MLSKNYYYILGICLASALATVLMAAVGGFALSAFGSFGKTETAVTPAPFPRLTDGLQAQLNTALVPEFPFAFQADGNPFADKSGVSDVSLSGKQSNPTSVLRDVVGNSNINSSGVKPPVLPQMPPLSNPFGEQLAPPPPPNLVPVKQPPIDTKELVAERQRQIKLGQPAPSLPSVYGIDEVKPYGIVGSGSNNRVKLYSAATGARFSVASGTRFRDGTIDSISNEGVTFRRNSGETVVSRWVKNTGDKTDQPDAPIMRVEPSRVPQLSDNNRP
ncbi:MAG: hypothetical protein LH472_04775 [Pyrinomonadaceae bacterium]|nr:hypothetical protein [Pyrinomonadaceae bacterium]